MDLKFVTPDGLRSRVEDGLVLWQRDDTVDRVRTDSEAAWPQRGELFEAIETLGALRSVSIAPQLRGLPQGPGRQRRTAAEDAAADFIRAF